MPTDDSSSGTYRLNSEGGVAATHAPNPALRVLAGPATDQQSNTLRPPLVPIACFKIENVRFDFDSSVIVPEARNEMPFLKLLIDEHTEDGPPPDKKKLVPRASIFGHADPEGSDDYNKALSGRRAAVVYAMLTRRPEIWEDIYSDTSKFTQTAAGDKWGTRAIQIMLNGLPPDPSIQPAPDPLDVDGQLGPKTQDAVKRFQQSHGLAVDGDPGPDTRKALFLAYMDYLCVDSNGIPYNIDPTDGFLGHNPSDTDGKGDFQGCSEFNPQMLFSQDDLNRYEQQSDHTERDQRNSINRRVMTLLFRPCATVDDKSWPCPKAKEGAAGCRKRFWSDGDKRRKNGPQQRTYTETHDTFACRFYDRLVNRSPCEKLNSALTLAVTSIRFVGAAPIWYCRLPTAQRAVALPSFIILPAAQRNLAATQNYIDPAAERPTSGQPHWQQAIGAAIPDFSWPAAYLRDGAGGGTPQLQASFLLTGSGTVTVPPQVTVKVSAGSSVGISIPSTPVVFNNGVATDITLNLQGLPATVKHLNGFQLVWQFETDTDTFPPVPSQHTLFILDRNPRGSRLPEWENGIAGRHLWEVFVWSCTWADGKAGGQDIVDAIWSTFSPVAPPPQHPSGLAYWRNYRVDPPRIPQDLSHAIWSQDWIGDPLRSSGSCVVMDRIFLNCISLQGVQCVELIVRSVPLNRTDIVIWIGGRPYHAYTLIEFRPPSNAPFPEREFLRAPDTYITDGWYDTTTKGQGNDDAPPAWSNHWIAHVMLDGSWKLYDPSYGEGPLASVAPTAASNGGASFVALSPYEPRAVLNFRGAIVRGSWNNYPMAIASVDGATNWPRLYGFVLWTN